jgi:hypothetical protein
MIENIKWKVKTTSNQSFQPGIKFITLKITLVKTDDEYWDGFLASNVETGDYTVSKKGAVVYREYVEFNPVTLAALSYLQLLADTEGEFPARHAKSTQIMRTLDVLHRFWD